MRVSFIEIEEYCYPEYTYRRYKMSFIPPLSITVTGNKCGGCCRSSPVKEREAPLHYVVVAAMDGGLKAVPYAKMGTPVEAQVAKAVFGYLQVHIKSVYNVDWDDIPTVVKPDDLTKAPSVAQIKTVEAAAISFAEGVKKGKSSTGSIHTPLLKKSPNSEVSD